VVGRALHHRVVRLRRAEGVGQQQRLHHLSDLAAGAHEHLGQLVHRFLQFLAGLGEFVLALVDLLGVAFFHRLLEVGLTRADFVLGVEHLVFPFLLQGSVGAMGSDFVQGGFQARLLIGVAAGLGQFDLVDDALFFGGAAGQAGDAGQGGDCQKSSQSSHGSLLLSVH